MQGKKQTNIWHETNFKAPSALAEAKTRGTNVILKAVTLSFKSSHMFNLTAATRLDRKIALGNTRWLIFMD